MRTCAWVFVGAIANVAVTWAFALYAPFWPFNSTHNDVRVEQEWDETFIAWWQAHYPFDAANGDSVQPTAEHSVIGFDLSERVAPLADDDMQTVSTPGFELVAVSGTTGDGGDSAVSAQRVRIGWPMKSMTATRWRLQGSEGNTIVKLDGGAGVRLYSRSKVQAQWDFMIDGRILPFKPMVMGLTVNTALYAGALWLLLTTPFAVRRRIKRGLCGACGYDPGSGNVCGECGKPRLFALAAENRGEGEVKLDERIGQRIRQVHSYEQQQRDFAR